MKFVISEVFEQVAVFEVEAKNKSDALRKHKRGLSDEVDWHREASLGNIEIEKAI